jgi:hypothetical protein
MLSRFFFEPYKITINRYTLYRDEFMNSRFSKKRVLLCSGFLAFSMSSAYAESSDVTPLVFANDYVSTGAGAEVIGDIKANNYVTTGAYSSVIGFIETGAAVMLGANSSVGDVSDDAAVTFGANAYLSGTAFYTEPSKFRYQEVIRVQSEFKAMGKEEGVIPLAPTITTSSDLDPGFYSAASLATTAGITIQLNAHDQPGNWIFNITDILSFGANTKIELINPDPEGTNRIIWNSGGYTSVGAGAQIKGTILAHTYVSTGAGSTLSGVDSCGGIFSATSYVSIGADSVVGSRDCVTKTLVPVTSAPDSETVAPPSGMSLPNEKLIKNRSFEEGNVTVAGVENFEITSGDFNDPITTGAGNYTVNLAGRNDEATYTMAVKESASDAYHGGAGVGTLYRNRMERRSSHSNRHYRLPSTLGEREF